MSVAESPWSLLPSDILKTIATSLENNADVDTSTLFIPIIHRLRLRSVCKSWRSSICPPPPDPPTTILPYPSLNPTRRGHFTLSLNTIYLLHQPLLRQSSSTSPKYWLLRVETGNMPNKWRTVNPLSRVLGLPDSFPESINLLNLCVSEIATLYMFDFVDLSETHNEVELSLFKYFLPKKVVLSNSGPLTAMAILGSKLASLKIGDENWRVVDDSDYADVIFSRVKFYAVDTDWRTVSFDVSNFKASDIVPGLHLHDVGLCYKRFVDCNCELFLIEKYLNAEEETCYDEEIDLYEIKFVSLKIYRLNEKKREWEGVNDLGDYVFFYR